MSSLVTVYVPTRNRIHLLKRAVDSVLAQSYGNFELIVVNDGSNDSTFDYLETLKRSDSRIKVLHHSSSVGPAGARNLAIQQARGDFVTGLDDDDLFAPDRLEIFVGEWSDEYSFLCTPQKVLGSSRLRSQKQIGSFSYKDLLHQNLVGNQIYTRAERLRELGGFDESLQAWEDYDLFLKLTHRYGPARKLHAATYVLDTSEQNRVSASAEKAKQAFSVFLKRYGQESIRVEISLNLSYYEITGENIPLGTFFKAVLQGCGVRATKIMARKIFSSPIELAD